MTLVCCSSFKEVSEMVWHTCFYRLYCGLVLDMIPKRIKFLLALSVMASDMFLMCVCVSVGFWIRSVADSSFQDCLGKNRSLKHLLRQLTIICDSNLIVLVECKAHLLILIVFTRIYCVPNHVAFLGSPSISFYFRVFGSLCALCIVLEGSCAEFCRNWMKLSVNCCP